MTVAGMMQTEQNGSPGFLQALQNQPGSEL